MATLTTLVKRTRIHLLKKMHHHILNLDDEEKYYAWITFGVPDELTEEDYKFIAEHDDLWKATHTLFMHLTTNKE